MNTTRINNPLEDTYFQCEKCKGRYENKNKWSDSPLLCLECFRKENPWKQPKLKKYFCNTCKREIDLNHWEGHWIIPDKDWICCKKCYLLSNKWKNVI